MNTAVLLFSACLAGADPAPAAPAPAPVVVYPGNSGDCCGKASVCGDCCDKANKCCLIDKIKRKLSGWKDCFKCDLCDKVKNCNICDKGNKCDSGCNNQCQQPKRSCCEPKSVCEQPKQDCGNNKKSCCNLFGDCCKKNDNCGKADVCAKVETNKCDNACDKGEGCCTKIGNFLRKCKDKLSCGEKKDCCGGCGTASSPACGTTVVPPATTPATPVKPAETKKIPEKVGSAYPMIKPALTPVGTSPKTIELAPIND